jgi:hypothetical protein
LTVKIIRAKSASYEGVAIRDVAREARRSKTAAESSMLSRSRPAVFVASAEYALLFAPFLEQ